MKERSLKDLLLLYIGYYEDRQEYYTSYIGRFIDASKGIKESLDAIYSNKRSMRLKYEDILSRTPEQIRQLPDGVKDLSDLIHAFIRMLPFTERLTAIRQFNELFTCGVDGFRFSELQANTGRSYCAVERLFDQTEMEVLLLKRLQNDEYKRLSESGLIDHGGGSRQNGDSRDRVAKEFRTSPQSLLPYLNRLEHGTNILGHDIRIALSKRGIAYDDTVHPVFLTLNPSEAALLTIGLKQKYADSDQKVLAERIADDIYSQLSEQVREKIDAQAKRVGVGFPENAPQTRDLRQYRQEKGPEGYHPEIAHKRAAKFDITLKDDLSKIWTGILVSRDEWEYELLDEHGIPLLKNEDGSARIIHRDEIVRYEFIKFK
ncbi:MAG: hypothetical protein IJJ45_12465 [Clostridia bacterium]|nr:hypothetical protein [Clostridia bacterium]MBQ6375285.1 hypothetical protein [Clostridia bacterium]